VRLIIRRQGDLTSFQVSDTGIGMAPEQLERLFLPFEQADGSTTTVTPPATGKRLSRCCGSSLILRFSSSTCLRTMASSPRVVRCCHTSEQRITRPRA
jgi:signal transduction histidine kinase